MMNEKAASIGAKNSHFANPNGLTDPNHYTTAEDMAKIAVYAMKNSDFRDIVKRKTYPMTYKMAFIGMWQTGMNSFPAATKEPTALKRA